MKYLFFDLEYASQIGGRSKICEFGYVVTDEYFNLIRSDNFIIDPSINKDEWDYRVLRNILNRSMDEYESNLKFNSYYKDIKELIDSADYIFGHSLSGDAKALNDDCLRYNLPSINFNFYDVKELYKLYIKEDEDVSLINMLKELELEGNCMYHDANADAYNTMLVLKRLIEVLNKNIDELISLCPNCKDNNCNYIVASIRANKILKKELINNFINNPGEYKYDNKLFRTVFIPYLKKYCPFPLNQYDVRYCFSKEFETNNFIKLFNIVKILSDNNCAYVSKPSLCDVFVKYDSIDEDGNLIEDFKLERVNDLAIDDKAYIDIIGVQDFYSELGINEEELNKMELPDLSWLIEEENCDDYQ